MILTSFPADELEQIAFDLGVGIENMRGKTAAGTVRNLIEYFEHRSQLYVLIDYCQQKRPWGGLVGVLEY